MNNELSWMQANTEATQSEQLADILAHVSARLEAGDAIDWDHIYSRYPRYANELDEIRPAMDALQNIRLSNNGPQGLPSRRFGMETSRNLGDFRILREIGRGGMGLVYEAEQISIRRRVALKILPLAELIDVKALTRFKNEVTAIATLEHPNIVSVYSIGEEKGIHYYAMKLIRGQSLAAVVRELQNRRHKNESVTGESINQVISDLQSSFDAQDSSKKSDHYQLDKTMAPATVVQGQTGTFKVIDPNYFRNIVRLILPVTEALQHAHEHGIVHRDIKPGNLLLDKSGKLYVADFGLARIEAGAGVTMTGDVIGTLRYMSPEQVLAGRVLIDHRTDVYSLGATLYELITLQPIWSGQNRAELISKISFDEPIRPQQINPVIPRDLETIVLKAISKNPADRYDSAQSMADDLQRFLDNKPIAARPPTILQRLGKWSYRNQPIVVSTLLVLLLATIGLAISNILILKQKQIANQKTDKARTQNQYARAVADFVKDDFFALTGLQGQVGRFQHDIEESDLSEHSTLRELLDRAAEKLDDRNDLDPLIEAELRWIVGMNYLALGKNKRAIKFLQQSVKLHRIFDGEDAETTIHAETTLANAYSRAGHHDRALSLQQLTLERCKKNLGQDHPLTLRSMFNLAWCYRRADQLDIAYRLFQQTVEMQTAILGQDHDETLNSMTNLAGSYVQAGQYDKALRPLERAVELQTAKLGDRHPDTLVSMNRLGWTYYKAARFDKSIRLLEQTVETQIAQLGEDHPETLNSMKDLAAAYSYAGPPDKSISLHEEILEIRKAKLGEDHHDTLNSMTRLAWAFHGSGQPNKSISLHEQVLEINKAKLGEDHPETLKNMRDLAWAYKKVGQFQQARPLLEQTLEIRKAKLGEDHPDTLKNMRDLAWAIDRVGLHDKSISLHEQVLEIRKAKLGEDHPDTLNSMKDLAWILDHAGQHDQSISLFEQTFEARKAKLGKDHPQTLKSMGNLARVHKRAGQLDKSIPLFEQIVEMSDEYHADTPADPNGVTWVHNSMFQLAKVHNQVGQLDKSIHLFEQTLEMRQTQLGIDHPETLVCMRELGTAYAMAGQVDKALTLLEQTLKMSQIILGENNPDTLVSMSQLGAAYRDAGQLDNALPLLERSVEMQTTNLGKYHDHTLANKSQLAATYRKAGQLDKALPLLEEMVETRQAKHSEYHLATLSSMNTLASAYLQVNAFADAEQLLWQTLAHCEVSHLDHWTTFNTKSMLGEALVGQLDYTIAEPLLLSGYQGLVQRKKVIPPFFRLLDLPGEQIGVDVSNNKTRIGDSIARLVQLYEAWHQQQPDAGYDIKAAQWRHKLEEENGSKLAEH